MGGKEVIIKFWHKITGKPTAQAQGLIHPSASRTSYGAATNGSGGYQSGASSNSGSFNSGNNTPKK